MTPLRFARNFFLVEGLWMDTRIPNFQVPIPKVFFSRAFIKIKFLGEILIITKLAFEITF